MRAIKTRRPLFLSISRRQNSDGKLQTPKNSPVLRLADVRFAHARDSARTAHRNVHHKSLAKISRNLGSLNSHICQWTKRVRGRTSKNAYQRHKKRSRD